MRSRRRRTPSRSARSRPERATGPSSRKTHPLALSDGARVRRTGARAALAARLGRRGHLRGRQRRPAAALLRAHDVPVPVGCRPTRATSATTPTATWSRATSTMQGYAVLSPLGFDSFGLPAENAAIKTGHAPAAVHRGTDRRAQGVARSGSAAVFDWRREVRSHDPLYIHGNQLIFLRLLEEGLAYRASATVNWCPGCQTVLANEQVLADGTCERSGDLVERRELEQWFFRITELRRRAARGARRPRVARAREDDAAQLDRSVRGRRVRPARRRPRRSRAPGLHDPARHRLRRDLRRRRPRAPARSTCSRPPRTRDGGRRARRARARSSSEVERMRDARGRRRRRAASAGRSPGSFVRNPFNGAEVPVYVADYVLMGYGTGAIMAVPAEDERDFAFAPGPRARRRAHRRGRPRASTTSSGGAWTGDGVKVNSGFLDGMEVADAIAAATAFLEREADGVAKVNYRLRDWLVSRQRFWGCPIPIVYCGGVRDRPGARRPAARPRARRRDDGRRRAGRRSRPTAPSSRRRARRAAVPPSARPTRSTRSSTRAGTSCASATSPTRSLPFDVASRRGSGCRSASTSAASSTRSCTCSTRASSCAR